MRRWKVVAHFLCCTLLVACAGEPPVPTSTSAPAMTSTPHEEAATPAASPTLSTSPAPAASASDARYASLDAPLMRRSDAPAAAVENVVDTAFSLYTGDYRLSWSQEAARALSVTRPGRPTGLALRPLGADLNVLQHVQRVSVLIGEAQTGVMLTGSAPWADFAFWLWVYPYNPGLIRYRLELTPRNELPSGRVDLEWTFVDAATGEEAPAGYAVYADKASFAAPSFYGYAEALDSTLLHWVDLTRLNPFIEATHYSPTGTPARRGRQFGHELSSSDLRRLPAGQTWTVYDSYLYLAPGAAEDEAGMFTRYLHQVGDIYDLIAHPKVSLPDWQSLAQKTLNDLQDPDTWVELNSKRYWRAYVADTRQSAEAITQLDVGLAAARYAARYGSGELADTILKDVLAALPDFYNPAYGMLQNSGPLAISGDQTRGDTWYELGHALKAAELGLLGYDVAADLARDSQAAWVNFAQIVNYKFPQFYTFTSWKGTGREPDAAGGYALYMLRLADLGCGEPCLEEAQAAVRAFPGHGFSFAYETHMTAMAALAAAELADRTGDEAWLAYAYGPIANLLRLSWIYEVDYGAAAPAHTFFGLPPTQRAGAITPKEQYEAWIYLTEFLRRAHGRIDPSVEKLVAEFCYHTLVTLADSLPPRLPDGVATEHPAAYAEVTANRLDLYIPLEDMRDGQSEWGAIGQEVYGAGMAPTFAALAYQQVAPGVTVYSGYPLAKVEDTTITFVGAPGTYAQAVVSGAGRVFDRRGNPVETQPCGAAVCFQAEGGGTYQLSSLSN